MPMLRDFSPSKVLRYFKFDVIVTKELLISVGEMLLRPVEPRVMTQVYDVTRVRVPNMKIPKLKRLGDYISYVRYFMLRHLSLNVSDFEWATAHNGDTAPYSPSVTSRNYKHLPRTLYWFFKKNKDCVKSFRKRERSFAKRQWWVCFYQLYCLIDRLTDPHAVAMRIQKYHNGTAGEEKERQALMKLAETEIAIVAEITNNVPTQSVSSREVQSTQTGVVLLELDF